MHERSGGATDGVRVRSPIGDEYPFLELEPSACSSPVKALPEPKEERMVNGIK